MGMLFNLRQVNREDAKKLIDDPSDIYFFLYGEEMYQPEKKKGFFSRFFGKAEEKQNRREWIEPKEEDILDLDKLWHILHYIFARKAWGGTLPEGTLLLGGTELGNIDIGYGPARAILENEISNFSKFLESLNQEEFAKGITAQEIDENEVYYPEWSDEEASNLWETVLELRAFFKDAKEKGSAVIMYLY